MICGSAHCSLFNKWKGNVLNVTNIGTHVHILHFIRSHHMNVIKTHAGRQGAPPCLWPLVRLSPEPVFRCLSLYNKCMSPFLLRSAGRLDIPTGRQTYRAFKVKLIISVINDEKTKKVIKFNQYFLFKHILN